MLCRGRLRAGRCLVLPGAAHLYFRYFLMHSLLGDVIFLSPDIGLMCCILLPGVSLHCTADVFFVLLSFPWPPHLWCITLELSVWRF